jgi:hypothetical protein
MKTRRQPRMHTNQQLANASLSHFGSLNLPASPLNLPKSKIAARISNRHTMQLEINASHAESTTSLFLIVPKCMLYRMSISRIFRRHSADKRGDTIRG